MDFPPHLVYRAGDQCYRVVSTWLLLKYTARKVDEGAYPLFGVAFVPTVNISVYCPEIGNVPVC